MPLARTEEVGKDDGKCRRREELLFPLGQKRKMNRFRKLGNGKVGRWRPSHLMARVSVEQMLKECGGWGGGGRWVSERLPLGRTAGEWASLGKESGFSYDENIVRRGWGLRGVCSTRALRKGLGVKGGAAARGMERRLEASCAWEHWRE